MAASRPPRAPLPADKPSLIGLSRAAPCRGARRIRRAGAPGQHAGRPALALALCARRHRFRRHDQRLQGSARRARRRTSRWRARRSSPSRSRRTAPANGCSAFRRAAPGGRSRSRPSTSPRKAAARSASRRQVGCTLTCTFCHTGTQKLVRNLTAEEIVGQLLARARPARRLSRRRAAARRGGAGDRPPRLQHRHDGHGRAALQFRQRQGGAADRLRRRRHRPVEAPHHALDLRRRADDRARRRGDRRRCWRSRCTPSATICATCWCRSTRNIRSRSCSPPAAPIPACRMPAASPSNM